MRGESMILIRYVIIFALMAILFNHPGITPKTVRQTENDKALVTQTTLMDKSIIKYYRMRSELPPDLSKETLKEMGIMQLADDKIWSYTNNGDSYVLVVQLSNKKYTSPYSNKTLPEVIRYPDDM